MSLASELTTEKIRLCFLAEDNDFDDVIGRISPASYRATLVNLREVLHEKAIKGAELYDIVLWKWDLKLAHEIGRIGAKLREQHVLLVAVCEDEADVIPALLTGADEALPFPVDFEYLEARLAVYHRWIKEKEEATKAGDQQAEVCATEIKIGPITLDLEARMLFVQEEPVELSFKEFELLHYLMAHPGDCCTRDDILDQVWDLDFDTGTNMVEVYMFYLRRKLKKYDLGNVIQTVRGAGYRFSFPTEDKQSQ